MSDKEIISIEERNKAVIRRWYDEMYANRHWELMPELAGPLYIRHDSTGTYTVTVEEHMNRVKELYGGSERIQESEEGEYELIAEGDKVCVLSWFKGYRKGGESDFDLYNCVQLFRFENGKIVETWFPGFVKNVEW
jgi:predicted SnoaL-like aldol condensation-catalyzing enzyme